jgi:hypothetical protein
MAFPCFKFQKFSGGVHPHTRDRCYPPLISNDKWWLFFLTFCAFFPLFISNTSIVRINFGANLDAQNAGNDISGIQISNIFWGSTPQTPPPFMRGILATNVAFSHCYPPLIYYITERSLFKKCPPPHGKILKKGPALRSAVVSIPCEKSATQGSYGSWKTWKVMEFQYSKIQSWKINFSHGKSWKIEILHNIISIYQS